MTNNVNLTNCVEKRIVAGMNTSMFDITCSGFLLDYSYEAGGSVCEEASDCPGDCVRRFFVLPTPFLLDVGGVFFLGVVGMFNKTTKNKSVRSNTCFRRIECRHW